MHVLRTPDDRFDDLPGYRFEPHYVDVSAGDGSGALRMHYIDEGDASAPPVLLLHGEPTWSFLYRKVIPPIVAAGLRAVAVDLVGFGRSDKPAARTDYTYLRHVEWTWAAVDAIGLRNVTLFGQDWGGLIGLRMVAEHPDRFARVVVGNTGLPEGDRPMSDAFMRWREFSQTVDPFPVGAIVSGGCATDLAPEVVAAYDAPFPDEAMKEGAREFPVLVPIARDDPAVASNLEAWEVLERFDKPFLTAFSDGDPVTRGNDAPFRERIPGARGRPHTTIEGAGHFLQEDRGEQLADVITEFVRAG